MFWAINETGMGTPEETGLNVNTIARYAETIFADTTCPAGSSTTSSSSV